MKYFEFKYIESIGKEMINQGDALYYTSAEQNIEEMKKIAQDILQKPSAVVNIILITEIDRGIFIQKGGNPTIN